MSQPPVRAEVKLSLLVTILVCVSMWLYHGSTENLFVWDSHSYLFKYENDISSLTAANLRWMVTSLEVSNWHPLTWFSWAVDYQLYGGLNSWGFHFSNNVIHSVNGALVFILILTVFGLIFPTGEILALKRDNNSLIAAFLASLLFLVHPQHVESVAWVAERKDLLCQLFLLLSLLAYIKYVTGENRVRKRWYLTTLSFSFLAVVSKPMAVTFPAVLMLVDIYPLGRTGLVKPVFRSIRQQGIFSLLVEKIPFFLMSFVLVLLTLMAQESAISFATDTSLTARLANAVHSVIFYIEKFLVPLSLSPHYPYFQVMEIGGALKALLLFLIFIGITSAAVLAWRKQKPAWLIVWLFYLGTLVPVLGLIQVGSQGAADRYAYFPTLPFYILIASGIFVVLSRRANIEKSLLLVVSILVISLFAIQTEKQIQVWQSEFSLWTHAIKVDANNQFAHNNLGVFYINNADYENAALEFEAVGENASVPHSTLARQAFTYMHLGRYKESIDYLVRFGMIADSFPGVEVNSNCIQYNIGWNFAHLEMYQESADLFSRVESDSDLGPDASVWLDALKNAEELGDESIINQELPGICEKLIPAETQAP